MSYVEEYRRSLEEPDGFWLEAAEAIEWTRKPTWALDDTHAPLYRWFPDGELNTCHNALDRHVAAGHAFFAVNRPAYRPEAAMDGWKKISAFYGEHLGV